MPKQIGQHSVVHHKYYMTKSIVLAKLSFVDSNPCFPKASIMAFRAVRLPILVGDYQHFGRTCRLQRQGWSGTAYLNSEDTGDTTEP
jgi:hypothetical protein